MSKWVQHQSGQGEKWEVYDEGDRVWMCSQKRYHGLSLPGLHLPKSEYIEVPALEVWEDITDKLILISASPSGDWFDQWKMPDREEYAVIANAKDGYRLRKMTASVTTVKPDPMDPSASRLMVNEHKDVFIVEKRKEQP